jgi:hypothetical protein
VAISATEASAVDRTERGHGRPDDRLVRPSLRATMGVGSLTRRPPPTGPVSRGSPRWGTGGSRRVAASGEPGGPAARRGHLIRLRPPARGRRRAPETLTDLLVRHSVDRPRPPQPHALAGRVRRLGHVEQPTHGVPVEAERPRDRGDALALLAQDPGGVPARPASMKVLLRSRPLPRSTNAGTRFVSDPPSSSPRGRSGVPLVGRGGCAPDPQPRGARCPRPAGGCRVGQRAGRPALA